MDESKQTEAPGNGNNGQPPEQPGELTDDALDSLIDAMSKMKKPEGLEEKSFDEQLEDLSRHPAFMKEWDPNEPMSADMEGLMRMKYECEDPTAKAEAYKEDGNHEFKKKKYRIAIDNYTEGIKCKCPDLLLNAVLYTNRAAAQSHLGNFRTAFNDCRFARKFKSDHFKAINRGVLCCLEMKKYTDCIKWCDDALEIEPKNASILETRQNATKSQKALDRDERKEKLQERKALSQEIKLLQAIQSRGIKLAGIRKTDIHKLSAELLSSIETNNQHGAKVHLDAKDVLYWPVMFLYPEYTETDYIQVFGENQRIIDHLTHMFGTEVEPPGWDPDRKYKPHTINVYFEDKENVKLVKINKECSLLKVLKHDRYIVHGGTPSFILTVAGSTFEQSFLLKYK